MIFSFSWKPNIEAYSVSSWLRLIEFHLSELYKDFQWTVRLIGDKVNPEARRNPGSCTSYKLFPTCSQSAYFQGTRFQACPFVSKNSSSDCRLCLRETLVVSFGCSEFVNRSCHSLMGWFSLCCPHLGVASFSGQSFWCSGLGQGSWAWPYRKTMFSFTGNQVLSCFLVLFWKAAKNSS